MPTTGIDNATTQFAVPTVARVGRFGELALIECRGDLDRDAFRELASCCDAVAADDSVFAAILVLDCSAADWPSIEAHRATESLLRLRRRVTLFAFIENSLGASYALAASCGIVYARPAARIGLFQACDEGASACFEVIVTDARALTLLRPDALAHCSNHVVNGEAAEAGRLVDDLCPSPEALLAMLFRKQPKGEAQ